MLKDNGLYRVARNLQTQISVRSHDDKSHFRKYEIGRVLDVLVSEHQGLMSTEIAVPSPSQVASTAWIRTSRGVTQ